MTLGRMLSVPTLAWLSSVLLSCSRYEYRHLSCDYWVAPPLRVTAAAATEVQGQVGSADHPHVGPVDYARVILRHGAGDRVEMTDSLGRFRFADVAPGRYLLRIARIGFVPRGDSLTVGPDRGRAVVAVLRVACNDCCGLSEGPVRVRKPWWKVW